MPINVLVFPCGSEIGLEIHAALKYCKDIVLHGVSSVSDHGEFTYARYREITAHVQSAELAEQLNALIDEWQVDVVMPAHDSAIVRLAALRSELRARIAAPKLEQALLCRNKNATYAFFQGEVFVPAAVRGLADSYPIFAKPAVGQGSQGAEIIRSAERHRQLLECGIEYVFSEYLPGEEYTVDCISDSAGLLLKAAPRTRSRVKAGISVRTEPVALEPDMARIAERLAGGLKLPGAWFFQLKRDASGALKLLEVAPRIAGSMGLTRNLGINFPLLHIYACLGMPFSVIEQWFPLQMDRALKSCFKVGIDYDRVYLDLDDTLILGGQVNVMLMALLYQWRARGIPVLLLTRHASCPRSTLDRYCIAQSLFLDVIHVTDGSPKSAVIDPQSKAVFIDDAYRERLDVSRTLGIPVFDVDAAEQLLDWKR